MLHNLTGWHALIVLAILLLVFGGAKLPALAKGVGQSMRILKNEVREDSTAPSRETVPTATLLAESPLASENATTAATYRHVS